MREERGEGIGAVRLGRIIPMRGIGGEVMDGIEMIMDVKIGTGKGIDQGRTVHIRDEGTIRRGAEIGMRGMITSEIGLLRLEGISDTHQIGIETST